MSSTLVLPLTALVIFISAALQAAFGFGSALLAIPLLILLLGIKSAVPLVALVGISINLVILIRGWRQLEFREALILVLSSLAGIPVGLYLLINLPEDVVKTVLGLILIAFGIFNLAGFRLPLATGSWLAVPLGFIAGILGGAYTTNGPPVVIYGLLKGWEKERFRTTLQGYFLVTGIVIALGHGLAGLWSGQVLTGLGVSLPAVVLGVIAGERITSRISSEEFTRALYIMVILLGLLILL